MIVTVSNSLTIENPTAEMQMWCKKHLTLSNPDYQKKLRMNLWLGNTPKNLSLFEQRGDTLVLPFGTLRTLPDFVKENAVFIGDFQAAGEVSYGGVDIPLYDYQKTAVDVVAAQQYGIRKVPLAAVKRRWGLHL